MGLTARFGATTGRVVALTVVLGVFGTAPLALHRSAVLHDVSQLPWWVFALLFAVTEACVVRLRVRGEHQSISLSEVPLVMGLFLGSPSGLLTGRLLGSLAVFVVYRRQTPVKVAFNLALVASGTAIAEVTFLGCLSGSDPLGARACHAALLAAVAAGLLDAAALILVMSWYVEPASPREAVRMLLNSMGMAAVVGLIGVLPVAAFSHGEAALPTAVAGAGALLGYRAFAALSERHDSLERLYELSDALAAAPGSADVVHSVLRQSADLLHTSYAEVMLAGVEDDRVLIWAQRNGTLVRRAEPADDELATLPFPPGDSMVVRGDSTAEVDFLVRRGIRQALVVPLRIDGPVAGHLLVADRTAEQRRFGAGDVRLLETVANHSGVALRNGRLIERLHFEARHDELTGLPNRLHFRERLDQAAVTAADGVPCAVMVLDFDGFKAVNDTLGHHAGDALLRTLGRRFQSAVGGEAIVARLGGDEFAVLAVGCPDADAAQQLATRLLAAFDEPVALGETRLRVGGSLGIALGPEHGVSGSDLLRHADLAMYAAKSGTGSIRLFTAEMAAESPASLRLASDLRGAVAADEIDIVIQPLVELATGAVHSVEVLARWNHPILGEIAPEDFFEAARRSGQIPALSARILDRALAACRTWHRMGRPVRVAVNLAARWLADPSLTEQIALALARHDVPANLLCLEITESGVISDPRRAVETLTELHGLGIHLSVDDFGTGYSSLTYLSRLPADQIKIDKAFVEGMTGSVRDRAIVQSIIDLGRNLGLEVVAEGVTDGATRQTLLDMGCSLGQGYLFTPPVTVYEVPGLLRHLGVIGRPLPGGVFPAPMAAGPSVGAPRPPEPGAEACVDLR